MKVTAITQAFRWPVLAVVFMGSTPCIRTTDLSSPLTTATKEHDYGEPKASHL